MKRRMVDAGLWANAKFAQLPAMARLLQLGIINLADDQGRMIAHPSYLRSQIFTYDEEVTGGDIRKWLGAIAANGTIRVYVVDGKEYLQLENWWEYQNLQYASPSDLPRPDGWKDRVRYNAKGGRTLTCNWVTPSGETPADTCNEEGAPLPVVATLPPRNPGGRPRNNPPENSGGNPPVNTNNDQIRNKPKQEGDRAREPYQAQLEPGEYMPGLPLPRQRQAQCSANHMADQRKRLGLSAAELTALTDTVLDRMNATEIAALDTDIGNDELRQAQEVALALAGTGNRTPEAIGTVFDTWYTHDWRGEKNESPSYKQIVEHAKALPKLLQRQKATQAALSEAEKSKILTRAKSAQSSIRTAKQMKMRVNPEWEKDVATARGYGLL